MRWRLPVTFGAGWIGGIVGMKQAQIAAKNYIHAIEDPALRTVYVLRSIHTNNPLLY